jgi:hypothetical protein
VERLKTDRWDFFFLTYDEPFGDEHFARLRERCPWATRLSGVKGVHEAVYKAASQSSTRRFFLLDADGVLDERFQIAIPPEADRFATVVWRARNDAVGLEYGHGGLKLYDVNDLDCTGSVLAEAPADLRTFRKEYDGASGSTVGYLQQVANENRFNRSPLTAWRGAFRECFKMAFEEARYGTSAASAERLERWRRPKAHAENAGLIRRGAEDGIAAARQRPEQWLPLVNDFDAMRAFFVEHVAQLS